LQKKVFSENISSSHMILIRSILDECDSLQNLPNMTIANAVMGLGMEGRGYLLLANCARRRGRSDDAVAHVWSFLEIACEKCSSSEADRSEDINPKNLPETLLAAEALKEIKLHEDCFAEHVLKFLYHSKDSQNKGHAWHAMRLAAASICIPDIVMNRMDTITQPDNTMAKYIRAFFQGQALGGSAIRHYLIRCLVSRFDEKGIADCGICEKTLGEWMQPFLAEIAYGHMEGLLAVPEFKEHLEGKIDDNWCRALPLALKLEFHESDEEFGTMLKRALEDSDLAFCRLPVAIWCVLLNSKKNDGCLLATEDYRSELNFDGYYFPGAPEGGLEMMRRMGQQLGVRSVCQCACGFLYVIGECGRPMQVAKCPQCRKDIGGTNHNFANGDQGVATIEQHGNVNIIGITDSQRTDAVRGMDWSSSGGQDYGERDLEPLEYRILCLLLLIPLAVFSPRRNDRLAQLRRHWDAFKAVSGTSSDTEGQQLLVGILVRAAQDSDVVNALTMTGCDYGSFDMRLATETTFRTALRSVFNGQTPDKIVAEVQQRMDKLEDERQVCFVLMTRRLFYVYLFQCI